MSWTLSPQFGDAVIAAGLGTRELASASSRGVSLSVGLDVAADTQGLGVAFDEGRVLLAPVALELLPRHSPRVGGW